nr:MAG TPA: hypothetical protein [Caudoviricetes sp.]
MSENKLETTSQQTEKQENIQTQFEERLGVNQEKSSQKSPISEEFKKNLKNLQIVLTSGLINPQQGQNLLNHIIQEALNMNVQNMREDLTTQISDKESSNGFTSSEAKFFDIAGRNEVINYLKSGNVSVDKDELSRIAKLVETIENSAVERYIQKVAHEQNLEKSNLQAKQKLQANAQNTKSECKNLAPFTREQIGKMTSAEFLKNEALIMSQLKKGLIK